ncbi:spore coat protein [Desulfotomaculum defluvii]
MTAQYGAHEVMELHEVLTDVIDGINQFELYRPHVTDQNLSLIMDRQINFMTQEYNDMVQALTQKGMTQARQYNAPITSQPVYGLDNPKTQSPNTSYKRLDNRDVASGMLGCLKSSAILKSMASLECADLNLRRMVQQGSINCSEMAYEIWQYMNQNGYYQVPTMKQMTTDTMISTYTPTNMQNMETQGNAYNNNFNAMSSMNNYMSSVNMNTQMDNSADFSNIAPMGSYQ